MEYLKTVEMWERVLETRDPDRELLLLKLSPICRTSRIVQREFDRWYESLGEDLRPVVFKVDVVAARETSRRIADQLQIRHQSPQAIWLDRNMAVKWHASHHAISAKRLNEQLHPTQTEQV